jgi:hypothetical protein
MLLGGEGLVGGNCTLTLLRKQGTGSPLNLKYFDLTNLRKWWVKGFFADLNVQAVP